MARRAALSKAELETARIVWSLGDATVRQVLEALPPERQVEYKTVQTFLRRLEAKGYLNARREGKTIHYRPRIGAAQVVRETVRDFIARLFDGQALPLVQHLISDRALSLDEIAELRAMLNRLDADQKDRDAR
ncbi:MAG TPA: BlaI/MecI/CopY family transcriptional regulator [Pirellulales bacterium]|jgi:predicted transcriptional regulator|nr:BlaI/MecI/CopY family transcriptional regulator [Pirellulales bacterium]